LISPLRSTHTYRTLESVTGTDVRNNCQLLSFSVSFELHFSSSSPTLTLTPTHPSLLRSLPPMFFWTIFETKFLIEHITPVSSRRRSSGLRHIAGSRKDRESLILPHGARRDANRAKLAHGASGPVNRSRQGSAALLSVHAFPGLLWRRLKSGAQFGGLRVFRAQSAQHFRSRQDAPAFCGDINGSRPKPKQRLVHVSCGCTQLRAGHAGRLARAGRVLAHRKVV